LVRSAAWFLVGHDALEPDDDELEPLEPPALVDGSLLEHARSSAVSATARAMRAWTRGLFIPEEDSNRRTTDARRENARVGVGPAPARVRGRP
jgi:hypothetical protein